jgi:hypothetical protein
LPSQSIHISCCRGSRYRGKEVFDIRIRQPCLRIGVFVKISLWSICVRSRISKSENPFERWSNLVDGGSGVEAGPTLGNGRVAISSAPTLAKIGRKLRATEPSAACHMTV